MTLTYSVCVEFPVRVFYFEVVFRRWSLTVADITGRRGLSISPDGDPGRSSSSSSSISDRLLSLSSLFPTGPSAGQPRCMLGGGTGRSRKSCLCSSRCVYFCDTVLGPLHVAERPLVARGLEWTGWRVGMRVCGVGWVDPGRCDLDWSVEMPLRPFGP